MSTITTLVGTDGITTANSMAKINTNFSNLNSDKIETSYLDTDTTLAANSDSKIATQKAVKAYVDSGGNVNASETTRGIVEEATDAEVTAGTATGATSAKLFVTPAKLATRMTTLLANYADRLSSFGATVTFASSTAENTLISFTVPGGTLSTANVIKVRLNIAFLKQGAGSNTSLTLRFKYGATTIISKTFADAFFNTAQAGSIEFYLNANASTSAQSGIAFLNFAANPTPSGTARTDIIESGTATEVSTGDLTLAITAQFQASSANDTISVFSAVAEVIR